MEIYQLRYFLAVVETGGFSKAAERVFVTQPSLSAGIKKLEGTVGRRLFERGPRRVALTPAGARLVDRARAIMAEIGAARVELAEAPAPARLRLGVLTTIPTAGLARLIGDFHKSAIRIRIDLRDGAEPALAAWLDQRRIDAALTVLPPGPRRGGSRALFRSHLMLGLAEGHALCRRGVIPINDLDDLPMILRTNCEFLAEARNRVEARRIRPRIVYRTDRDERALALCAAGLGAVLVPDRLAWPGVTLLPVAELALSRTIGLAWQAAGEALAGFRDFAASHDWRPGGPSPDRLDWAR